MWDPNPLHVLLPPISPRVLPLAERDMTVSSLEGFSQSWGAALWEMEDTRRRTLAALDGLDEALLDQIPSGGDNSIGSLLYHLALIEADWLYADILIIDYPEWVVASFPEDARDDAGSLTRPQATLAAHLDRLALVRFPSSCRPGRLAGRRVHPTPTVRERGLHSAMGDPSPETTRGRAPWSDSDDQKGTRGKGSLMVWRPARK
jgi:hypothetical protein